jgi:hypothetical protein
VFGSVDIAIGRGVPHASAATLDMRPSEAYAKELYEALTGTSLEYEDGRVDFRSRLGDVAVEVMELTSEAYKRTSQLDRDSAQLARRWYFHVRVNRLGEPEPDLPSRRDLAELESALVECERLGIREFTRFRPVVQRDVGMMWPEPLATVFRLLRGRPPAVMSLAMDASHERTPGITIRPWHGGWGVADADGVAAALNSLIDDGHSIGGHIVKTQIAAANHKVLILLPDSTWGPAWDLKPNALGRGPLPTSRLRIEDPSPLEIWLVGSEGLVWVYTHPAGTWRQRQDGRGAAPADGFA